MTDLFDFNNERPRSLAPDFGPMTGALIRPPAPIKKRGTGLLDLLGDYLMESTGLGSIKRRNELSNILQETGLDSEEAVRRAAAVDPDIAIKLQNQIADNERLQAAQDSTAEYRAQRTSLSAQAAAERKRRVVAAYVNSIMKAPEQDRAAAYAKVRPRLLAQYPDDDYLKLSQELPEQYDPIVLGTYANGGATVAQQNSNELGHDRLDETNRHNVRSEDQRDVALDQGQQRTDIMRDRANVYARTAGGSGKAKPIGRYPGEDGLYHVMFDDGSETTSNVRVRPPGKSGVIGQFGGGSAPKSSKSSFTEGKVYIQNGHKFKYTKGKFVLQK